VVLAKLSRVIARHVDFLRNGAQRVSAKATANVLALFCQGLLVKARASLIATTDFINSTNVTLARGRENNHIKQFTVQYSKVFALPVSGLSRHLFQVSF